TLAPGVEVMRRTEPMRVLTRRLSAYVLTPLLLALAAAVAFAALPAGQAHAAVDTSKIVSSWKNDQPVYQDSSAGVLSADDVEGLIAQIRNQDGSTSTPIYIAVLPQRQVK